MERHRTRCLAEVLPLMGAFFNGTPGRHVSNAIGDGRIPGGGHREGRAQGARMNLLRSQTLPSSV